MKILVINGSPKNGKACTWSMTDNFKPKEYKQAVKTPPVAGQTSREPK